MRIKNFTSHIILIFFCIIAIGPFLWLLSTALKSGGENIFAYPPSFIPEQLTFENFKQVWEKIPFVTYILNSFVVTFFTVILNLIFSSLAGYPLARMDFKGKDFIFYLVLSTLMVPFQTIMIPVYLIILKMNLVDSISSINGYLGLILPFAVNAFGIFLMRQAFLTIPKELEEAAIVDGCNVFKLWFKILLPQVKPALATLAVFTFVGSWSEFLWPSIVLTQKTMYTLPVGLNDLQGVFSANWRLIAAGSIISIVPILTFFIAMQKYFVESNTQSAIKG